MMAMTDIHIHKKIILKYVLNCNHGYHVYLAALNFIQNENLLGFYTKNTDVVCLLLGKINEAKDFFSYKEIEKKVCYCLTHEEIHKWLYDNISDEACLKFDNISIKFMEGM